MYQKLYKHALEAWKKIIDGDYYNDQSNTTLEFSIKSLKGSEYEDKLRRLILLSIPKLANDILNSDPPLPFIFILLSLNDPKVGRPLEKLFIDHWIKDNASQNATFHLLNLLNILGDKNVDIIPIVKNILSHANTQMDPIMINALAVMTINNQPGTLKYFIEKFAEWAENDNDVFLKDLIKMVGKKGLMELLKTQKTKAINKILKK